MRSLGVGLAFIHQYQIARTQGLQKSPLTVQRRCKCRARGRIGQRMHVGRCSQFQPTRLERCGDPIGILTKKPKRSKFRHAVAGLRHSVQIAFRRQSIARRVEYPP